jgi:lipid-A-disaccharide synthase-like uncharacterized protein
MLDGDGQNDPADIPVLVAALAQADVACGWRRNRRDNWSRRVSSQIANHLRRAVLNDGIRDTGCSLKAMRREHVRYLIPFNGLHRYIPALLKNAGLTLVEVPVNHRPRTRGVSKYTIGGRALRGLRDLAGVRWLLARQILFTPAALPANAGRGARPEFCPAMSLVLFHFSFFGREVVITGWKLVGYLGVLLFGGRWVVQLWASRVARRPVLPRLFWYMSITGSLLLLAYFTFGKNDSVGVLSNLFPAFTAGYNLWLELRSPRGAAR